MLNLKLLRKLDEYNKCNFKKHQRPFRVDEVIS